MTGFPNKAGDHADTDSILLAELKAAGIHTLDEEGPLSDFMRESLRERSGEVKTSVRGHLHGWTFERAWYYWMCSGPGIEIAAAERLQETHGETVRAAGDCGCRGPRFWFKGLACGSYHVDNAEGLKALADTIRGLAAPAPSSTAGDALPDAEKTVEHILRSMASNYSRAHSWDELDAQACIQAADEIAALRSRLAIGAVPAREVRMLTEDELTRAFVTCGWGREDAVKLTIESGPYSIDGTTVIGSLIGRAIQRKFCAVNRLKLAAVPTDAAQRAEEGGEPT